MDLSETALTDQQIRCINHWNAFVQAIPPTIELPSFPLWGDEFGAFYPFEDRTPFASSLRSLVRRIPHNGCHPRPTREQLLNRLPSYARTEVAKFPDWKVRFIKQNRGWYRKVRPFLPPGWRRQLSAFPASLRKLEWNCNAEQRDLWNCVLQFRPSGLRAKRYSSSPALVAMTVTQIPILGPERRFLTRVEGLRFQGFPDSHQLSRARAQAFAALGNAVHTGLVRSVASRLLHRSSNTEQHRIAVERRPRGRAEVPARP